MKLCTRFIEKMNGIIFKIDFEKAYDKILWDFLQQTLRMKGFSWLWCSQIESFVQGGLMTRWVHTSKLRKV